MEICKISPMGREVTAYAGPIHRNYGECCSSVSPIPGDDHEIATAVPPLPLTLARGVGGEEDCSLQKINGR